MSADQPPRDDRPATGSEGSGATPHDAAGGRRRDQSEGDVGAALRTVYQKTVDEKIPDEFLDLLGKLG